MRRPPAPMIAVSALAAMCIPVLPAGAQPATDIFLADLAMREGRLAISAPVNVTDRPGYDNQPWFLPDGSGFLYASERDGQTDIFRYEIDSRRSVRVTATPENEYSPTLPGDASRMMVVRWPVDMSTGELWWFTVDGQPLVTARGSVSRVGYYAFADDRTLALFINDSIQSFILADTETGDTTRVGAGMGGSGPRAIPGERAVSFLSQTAEDVWWLTRLDLDDLATRPLVPMLEGVTNYTWTQRGTVLAARGGTIYEWGPGGDWQAVANFSDPALQQITRIAVSPGGDRIALVSARPEP
jgi:hypothetical protein